MTSERAWWHNAVFYQIYPRSFADANGDGTGDLIGIRERLDYLVELGIDALWLSPFYRSPMADGGYDVSDPCDVDPMFGTLADFDALMAAARERRMRVTVDVVPNHFSDQHLGSRLRSLPDQGAANVPGLSSVTGAARTANCHRTTGRRCSVVLRGSGCRTGSGTCTCSRRSNLT